MTVTDFVKKVLFLEILKGLALTIRHFFSPAVTRQYPSEKREPFPGSRGLNALVRDPETGKAKCVGCGLCAAMCPSQCIHIYTSEGEDHKKVVDRYEIEVLRCVFCGLCVEACPYGAVALTDCYEYSGFTREEFYMNKDRLLKNWDDYMAGEKGRIYFQKYWTPRASDFRAAALSRSKEEAKT
ncbi:MAG: NADH-quinone oxidoreductase subunit NuoI [Nitrospiraceae bacterium]|nr:MAG: NADH-quinone oxidoreductase subunit NuoI [Nitrospiraceae bacterium]